MYSFTRRLNTQQGLLIFYFNALNTALGICYQVFVVGNGDKLYTANMEKKAKQWKLANPDTCPRWLAELEKTLERVIEDHLGKGAN